MSVLFELRSQRKAYTDMLGYFSVKNISLAVVDNDHSTISRELISKVTASGHF